MRYQQELRTASYFLVPSHTPHTPKAHGLVHPTFLDFPPSPFMGEGVGG